MKSIACDNLYLMIELSRFRLKHETCNMKFAEVWRK